MIANCYGGSNVLYMLILHSKCSINVPISCVWPGTCRNIWNVPNLLSVGKWWVHSTRACNVLKMFLLVSRPPRPQWYLCNHSLRKCNHRPCLLFASLRLVLCDLLHLPLCPSSQLMSPGQAVSCHPIYHHCLDKFNDSAVTWAWSWGPLKLLLNWNHLFDWRNVLLPSFSRSIVT